MSSAVPKSEQDETIRLQLFSVLAVRLPYINVLFTNDLLTDNILAKLK